MGNQVNKVNDSGQHKSVPQIPDPMEFSDSNGKFAKTYSVDFLSGYKLDWHGDKYAQVTGTLNYGGMSTNFKGYISKAGKEKAGKLYVDEASSTSGKNAEFSMHNTNYVPEAEVPKEAPVEPKPETSKPQTNYQDTVSISSKPEEQTQPAPEKKVADPVGAKKPQVTGKESEQQKKSDDDYLDPHSGQTLAEALGK